MMAEKLASQINENMVTLGGYQRPKRQAAKDAIEALNDNSHTQFK